MGSILGILTLVVRVVLVGHGQPNMVRRGQGRLAFESSSNLTRLVERLAVSAVLVDFAHGATLNPRAQTTPRKLPYSATTYPEPVPIMPIPQSGRELCRYKCSKMFLILRFVQLSVMPPRSRLFKSGGPRDRCNTNLGPNLRPVNSKTANFLTNVPKTVRKGSCV